MIVYKIAAIPDITLSKYQAYAESGVEGDDKNTTAIHSNGA